VHAKVREGRVVKLEGNPESPINQGRLCSRGQAGLQGLYNPDRITAQHPGPNAHDGTRLRQIGGGRGAIQENARPYQIERELRPAQRGGAIGDMEHRGPPRQAFHRAEKPFELLLRRPIAAVGRVQMRVAAFQRRRVHRFAQLFDFVPPHAGPTHARVDLDMEGTLAARRPFENVARIAERRRQLVAVIRVEPLRSGGHEDEDGPC